MVMDKTHRGSSERALQIWTST